MKAIIISLYLTTLLMTNFISFSQQPYFNNRYNLCGKYDPEAWSSSSDIIKSDDGYIIAGATVDTISFWMRRIPLMKLDINVIIVQKDYFVFS